MRILFLADFIPPRHIGGPGKRNWEVAVMLAQLGHEVFFITSCQKKEQEIEEAREGIKIFNIYSKYPSYLRDYFNIRNPWVLGKVKKIIKAVRPDVVHADIIHTHLSYASLKIAKKYARAVFLHARDFMLFNFGKFLQKERACGPVNYRIGWLDNLKKGGRRFNPWRNFFIRRYVKHTDKIFAVSEELAEALRQNGFLNVAVLHNSMPTGSEREDYKYPAQNIILLSGRINEAKGVYALLDAFELIKEKINDASVYLVGAEAGERERISRYLAGKKIAAGVKVFGWIKGEQMKEIIQSSAVVVSPSLYPDPFPGVNLEAALYKKPVVTTCFGGAKEFVLDGQTGYVVNPFDKKTLAAKIIDILANEERAKQFGEAAYQRLKQDFSMDRYVKKLLGWYRQYIK